MGYLENAACNGRRPKKIGPQRIYSRPRLVKRLVAERDVARFVVAPSGFGKTSLGLEYAASMFSFRGVHWLDCSSPCFLRDLDAGIIAKTLIARPAQLDLVVFDDVPFLADARSECFSHEIDALLEAGCEVLVTTTPAFGAIADAQRDCVIVGARDLLVDDCELSSSHVASVEGLRECDRVPAFLWGGQDGMREFLRGMRLGEMPSEMRAPIFVMEALQVGSFDDLSAVSGGVRADARRFISEHYPYVGVDLADETFEAHGFDVAQVMEGLGESIDSLGRVATPSARDALSAKVACMLAARGMGPRACEIMQIACARKRRISWILQQQWHLFDSGCVRPLQELFESLGARSTGLDASMVAAASGRLFVLGEKERASSVARCALGMRGISSTDALMCALVALDAGGESARSAALETLGNIAAGKVEVLANDALAGRIAVSAIALHKGDVAAACRALRNAGVDTHVLRTATVYCATLLRRVSPPCERGGSRHGAFSLSRACGSHGRFDRRGNGVRSDFGCSRCGIRRGCASFVCPPARMRCAGGWTRRAATRSNAAEPCAGTDAFERLRHAEPSPCRYSRDAREYIRRNGSDHWRGCGRPPFVRETAYENTVGRARVVSREGNRAA